MAVGPSSPSKKKKESEFGCIDNIGYFLISDPRNLKFETFLGQLSHTLGQVVNATVATFNFLDFTRTFSPLSHPNHPRRRNHPGGNLSPLY